MKIKLDENLPTSLVEALGQLPRRQHRAAAPFASTNAARHASAETLVVEIAREGDAVRVTACNVVKIQEQQDDRGG